MKWPGRGDAPSWQLTHHTCLPCAGLPPSAGLTDLLGPNPGYPRTGGYVANGAFVSVTSNATLGRRLGHVAGNARRGDDVVEVRPGGSAGWVLGWLGAFLAGPGGRQRPARRRRGRGEPWRLGLLGAWAAASSRLATCLAGWVLS